MYYTRFKNRENAEQLIKYMTEAFPGRGFEKYKYTGDKRTFSTDGIYRCGSPDNTYKEVDFEEFKRIVNKYTNYEIY